MPHIIVEYAESTLTDTQIKGVLKAIHQAVSDSGLFDASHIKTRAYAFQFFTQAGKDEPYIHIQARIKSGRDEANKKQFSDKIINSLKPLKLNVPVITVEVIDMDRHSYAKLNT